jgi:hypothetical protein
MRDQRRQLRVGASGQHEQLAGSRELRAGPRTRFSEHGLFAKSIAGWAPGTAASWAGLPIGVIAGKREYMDALDGGRWRFGDASVPEVGVNYFAGTFVRHPLAAAHASLSCLEREDPRLQQRIDERATGLADALNTSHKRLPCFLTVPHGDAEVAAVLEAFKDAIHDMQHGGFFTRREGEKPDISSEPPAAGAKLGRDRHGNPAWFMTDPARPGKYQRIATS